MTISRTLFPGRLDAAAIALDAGQLERARLLLADYRSTEGVCARLFELEGRLARLAGGSEEARRLLERARALDAAAPTVARELALVALARVIPS